MSTRLPAPQPSGIYKPERYGRVGPNYQKFGEQKQFYYDSYTDTYHVDPKAREQELQNIGVMEKPKEPPSLAQTLLPIAGVGTALYGGKYIGENIGSLPEKISGMFGGGEVAKQGAAQAAGTGSGIAGGFVESAGANGFSPVGMDAANYFPEQASGMFDLGGVGSAGNVLLPAAGAYGAYDLMKRDVGPGRGALQGAASGAAIGSYFGPMGAGIGAGVGGLLGLGKSFFDNPSVREQVKDRWGSMAQSNDPATAQYAKQYLSYLDSDQAKIDAEQGNTFGDKKAAGVLKPEDTWGGYGVINSVGSDYFNKWSEQQRRDYNQQLIDQNLLSSEKGDIRVTDSAKAKEIASQISNPQAQASKPTGMMEPRRSTPRPSQPSRSTPQRRKQK